MTRIHDPIKEYQPTAYRVREPLRVPPFLRAFVAVLALVALVVLAGLGIGRVITPPMVFAYVSASEAGEMLQLYEPRTRANVTTFQTANRLRNVRWLPSGAGFIVQDNEQTEWQALPTGGETRPLTPAEAFGRLNLPAPDWSKYLYVRDNSLILYDPDAGGGGNVPLLVDLRIREVLWSPDSNKIAVLISEPDAEARRIGIIDLAAGSWTIATPEDALYARMVWSPDSTQLAYAQLPTEVFVYDTGTEAPTQIPRQGDNPIAALAFSPKSDTLAYAVREGGLYLYHMGRRRQRQIMPELAEDTRLTWSPNGPWLLVRTGTLVEHDVILVNTWTRHVQQTGLRLPSQAFIAWQPRAD
ncbi:MAG: hypothetical protein AAF125_00105 [Chloroflexota bacterium]